MMVPVGRLVRALVRTTAKPALIRPIAYLTWPALVAPVIAPWVGAVHRRIVALDLPGQRAVGLAGLLLARRLVHEVRAPVPPRLNWRGAVLVAGAIAALVIGLEDVGRAATGRGGRGRRPGWGERCCWPRPSVPPGVRAATSRWWTCRSCASPRSGCRWRWPARGTGPRSRRSRSSSWLFFQLGFGVVGGPSRAGGRRALRRHHGTEAGGPPRGRAGSGSAPTTARRHRRRRAGAPGLSAAARRSTPLPVVLVLLLVKERGHPFDRLHRLRPRGVPDVPGRRMSPRTPCCRRCRSLARRRASASRSPRSPVGRAAERDRGPGHRDRGGLPGGLRAAVRVPARAAGGGGAAAPCGRLRGHRPGGRARGDAARSGQRPGGRCVRSERGVGAPGRIRTCAPASGGQCSIP